MNKFKFSTAIAVLAFATLFTHQINSQMKFDAGFLRCEIDGDTITFGMKTDLNDLYYMTMGGTADYGLIKIQWDVKTPSEVKVLTLNLEKGFIVNEELKISVIWADFLTNMPYIIKNGKLSITENSGNTIKGNLELTAELGGSPIIGDLLKGKKETVLKKGYFEINY
ncbi:MAG: hypothetical protein ACHQIH_00500 [Ignavibacteria bacterium]